MAKTFQFDRFDVDTSGTGEVWAAGDGEWIKAQDALDREKVNADRIRVLEVQLKEARNAGEAAMQAACRDLPQDWELNVCLEKDAGWVDLFYQGCPVLFNDDTDSGMTGRILKAIEAAKTLATT